MINHYLHLTCPSACSAAEMKAGLSINICLYLATYLVPIMLGSPPMPGDLRGIGLINVPESDYFFAGKTENPIL